MPSENKTPKTRKSAAKMEQMTDEQLNKKLASAIKSSERMSETGRSATRGSKMRGSFTNSKKSQ